MYKFWITIFLYFIATTPAHAAISFAIQEPVISSNELSVTASISGLATTSCDSLGKCYLQGTLRQVSASKYFGQTKNNVGTWVDYLSDPAVDYIQSTFMSFVPVEGGWSGIVSLRFAPDDSEYHGPGDYELKLRRFTGKSSGAAGDSNTLVVALAPAKPTPTPSAIPSPTPTPTPSPTAPPTPTPTPTPSPALPPKPSPKPSPSLDTTLPLVGTVAGATTEIDLSGFGTTPSPTGEPSLRGSSSQVESQGPTLNKSRAKTALTIGFGLILVALSAFFGYRKYRAIITP